MSDQNQSPSAQIAEQAKKTAAVSFDPKTAKMDQFIKQFMAYKAVYSTVMASKVAEIEKQIGFAAQIISKTPKLRECTVSSIMGSVLAAAMSGLDLSLKEAYLIPYGSECQFQISYLGYQKMAYNSGMVASIEAYTVFEGDMLKIEYGDSPKITHSPDPRKWGGEVVGSYAVAVMSSGQKVRSWLPKIQIEHLRLKNKSQEKGLSGSWLTDYPSMARAKAIKYLCSHFLPLSAEQREIMDIDGDVISVESFKEGGAIEISQSSVVE